jgi:hypothetical protein
MAATERERYLRKLTMLTIGFGHHLSTGHGNPNKEN